MYIYKIIKLTCVFSFLNLWPKRAPNIKVYIIIQRSVRHLYFSLNYTQYYVSIIPDRSASIPIFISDKPSVSIGTYFFRHDFPNGEGLERSDSESDTRRIG